MLMFLYTPIIYSAGITLTPEEKIAHKAALDEMMKTMHNAERWELSAEKGGQCIFDDVTISAGSDYKYKGITMRCVLFFTGKDIGQKKLHMLMPVRVIHECEKRKLTRKRGNSTVYSGCIT